MTPTPTTPAECRAEQERWQKLLANADTPESWYYQPGWGLQKHNAEGLGLIAGQSDFATHGDLLLLEAAPTLARAHIALLGAYAETLARVEKLEALCRHHATVVVPAFEAKCIELDEALEREARMAAECDMYRVTLQNLHQAAANMLTGIEVNNRLDPDAPARRKDIAGPVVTSLRAAVLSARVALSPNPPTGYAPPPAQAPASAGGEG